MLIVIVLELRYKLGPPTMAMIADIQILAKKILKLDDTLPQSNIKELQKFEESLDLGQFNIPKLFSGPIRRKQQQSIPEDTPPNSARYLSPTTY